jgi:hypothetical protein
MKKLVASLLAFVFMFGFTVSPIANAKTSNPSSSNPAEQSKDYDVVTVKMFG